MVVINFTGHYAQLPNIVIVVWFIDTHLLIVHVLRLEYIINIYIMTNRDFINNVNVTNSNSF